MEEKKGIEPMGVMPEDEKHEIFPLSYSGAVATTDLINELTHRRELEAIARQKTEEAYKRSLAEDKKVKGPHEYKHHPVYNETDLDLPEDFFDTKDEKEAYAKLQKDKKEKINKEYGDLNTLLFQKKKYYDEEEDKANKPGPGPIVITNKIRQMEDLLMAEAELLDKDTKNFIDSNFPDQLPPGYRDITRSQVAGMVGINQLSRLNDPQFRAIIEAEINADIEKYNKANIFHENPLQLNSNVYGSIISDPYNQEEIKRIMRFYFKDYNDPYKLQTILSYDPASAPVISPSELENIMINTKFKEMAPDKLAVQYAELLEVNKPPKYADILDDLDDIVGVMDELRKKYNAGDIDEKKFEEEVNTLTDNIQTAYSNDPLFQRAYESIDVKTKLDIRQFNDYIRQLGGILGKDPTSYLNVKIKEQIDNIKDLLKSNKIDLDQAYNMLHGISEVKEAVLNPNTEYVLDLPEDEAEAEKLKQAYEAAPTLAIPPPPPPAPTSITTPTTKAKKSKGEIPLSILEELQKQRLLANNQFILNATDIARKDFPFPIYDLSSKQLDDIETDIHTIRDGKIYGGKGKLTEIKFGRLNETEMKDIAKDIIDDLESRNIKMDPNINRFALAYSTNKLTKEEFKKLVNDLTDFEKQVSIIKDNKQSDELNVTDYINTRLKSLPVILDDIKSRKSKVLNKITKFLPPSVPPPPSTPVVAPLPGGLPGIAPLPGPVAPKFKLRKVKPQPQLPKVIIPAALRDQMSKENKALAKQAQYFNQAEKQPHGRKLIYGNGSVIEYRIEDNEDKRKMLSEIMPKKGKLYIIDLTSGRLFPISKHSDHIILQASYVFQQDMNGVGGNLKNKKHKKYKHHGSSAYYPTLYNILQDDEKIYPLRWMRNGNDKIPAFLHQINRNKNNIDYRDQIRNKIGGSIWKHIKNGLKEVGKDTHKYIVGNTIRAAKDLANQSVYEAKHFVNEEKKNIKNIYDVNKQFYKKPTITGFGKAVSGTVSGVGKMYVQPYISSARQLANVSDFASNVPGLNVVKYGIEAAIPPLAVADAAVHAVKNVDEGKYLDASINALDGIIGSGTLSTVANTGARLVNVGLQVADKVVDNH